MLTLACGRTHWFELLQPRCHDVIILLCRELEFQLDTIQTLNIWAGLQLSALVRC